jgi:hypothetical protein
MRQYKFAVQFVTGLEEIVYAFNSAEAIILAQAKQINKGNDYRLKDIQKV